MTWEDRDQPDEWLQPWEGDEDIPDLEWWHDGPEFDMAFAVLESMECAFDPDPYAPRARWVSDR